MKYLFAERHHTMKLTIALSLVLATTLCAGDAELLTLQVTHESALKPLHDEYEKHAADLVVGYKKALGRLEDDATDRGDLDTVLAARGEAKVAGRGGEIPASAEVAALRSIYDTVAAEIASARDGGEAGLLATHEVELLTLQVTLTKQKDIEGAKAARKARERVLERLKDIRGSVTARAPTKRFPLGGEPRPGLVVYAFLRLTTQKDDETIGLHYGDLGTPTGRPTTRKDFVDWKWEQEQNSVVVGYVKIEEAGTYCFEAYGWYDRVALYVGDLRKPVCRYRDRGNVTDQEVLLEPGMVPIIAVGYVEAKGGSAIKIHWRPPGKGEYEEIPADRLFHDRETADKLFTQK
jgi:hypothetical protein